MIDSRMMYAVGLQKRHNDLRIHYKGGGRLELLLGKKQANLHRVV